MSRRIVRLVFFYCAALWFLAPGYAGLRDILPPPQQMGLLSDEPMQIQGLFYLVVANGLDPEESKVVREAVHLIQDGLHVSPIVVSWSDYNGENPSLWMAVAGDLPDMESALDSVEIPSMSGTPPPEGYHLYVGHDRILLLGRGLNGLRYGLLSLSKLTTFFGGQRTVDRVYIRDWPDLPRRMITFNSSLQPTGDVDSLQNRLHQAYAYKMNEVEWNNTYSGCGTDWNSTFLSRAIAVRDSIRGLGMKLFMSADRTGTVVDNLCWQEGIPVRGQSSLIAADTAQALTDPSVTIVNAGFETFSNGQFQGWTNSQVSYPNISQDTQTKHSGSSSLKITQPTFHQPKVYQDITLQPYRFYRFSFWYKTSGFSGKIRILVWQVECDNKQVKMEHFKPSSTADWTKVTYEVHSFTNGSVRVYLGAYLCSGGTLWLDDFSIEEMNPLWMLRREDTPLTIYEEPGHVLLQEGSDFIIEERDPEYSSDCYVSIPRIRRVSGGRLVNGDRISMNWYCGFEYQLTPDDRRRTVCFSLLEPLASYQQKVSNCDSLFHPDGFKIHINEVPIANWDTACTSRDMTPGQLLGSYVRKMYNIIQTRRPGSPVQVYGDMFDIYQNSRDCHWGMNGSTTNSLNELNGLPITLLGLYGEKADSSLGYFSQQGFPSIAAHGGTSLQVGLTETEAARRYKGGGCQGASLYSWVWSDYDSIPSFASMAWNLGPHILHKPIAFTDSVATVRISAEIFADHQPSYLQVNLTTTRIQYRLLPGGSWQTANLVSQGADLYSVDINLATPGTSGIEYYIEAKDSRNRTHTAPADAPFSTFSASFPKYGGEERITILESPTATMTIVDGKPVVRWTPVKGATAYEVHTGPEPDFTPTPFTLRTTIASPGTVYVEMLPWSMLPERLYYRIVAIDTPIQRKDKSTPK